MAADPFGPNEGLDPTKPVEGLDPFAPDPNAPGPFKQGFGAGVAGVKANLAGAGALVAHGVGAIAPQPVADAAAAAEAAALEYAAQQGEVAAQGTRRIEDVDWTSPSAIAGHFKYLLGNALPSLALMFAGGVAGRGIGAVAGRYAPAAAPALKTAGMFAGAVAPDVALEAGGIYPEALKTGVGNPATRAAAGGAAAAALDFVPLLAAERYLKAAPVGKGGLGAMAKKAAIGAPVGAALEGTQELGQAVIERAAAGHSLTDAEAVSDYINSFAGGAAPGMLFGAGIGASRGRAAPAQPQPEQPPAPAVAAPEQPPAPAVAAPAAPVLTPEDEATLAYANLVTEHDTVAAAASGIEQKLAAAAEIQTKAAARLDELKAELEKPLGERRAKEAILAERKGLQAEVKAAKVGLEELGGQLKAHRDTLAALAPKLAEADQREAARVALANTPTGLNPAIVPKEGAIVPKSDTIETEPRTPQEQISRAVRGVHALFKEQGMLLPTEPGNVDIRQPTVREQALAKVEERTPRETVKQGNVQAQMQAVEPHAMQVIEPMAKTLAEAKGKTPEAKAKLTVVLGGVMQDVVQEAAKKGSVAEAQAHIVAELPKRLKGHGVAADAEDIAKAVSAAVGQATTVYSKGPTKQADYAKAGDTVTALGGDGSQGVVQRVVKTASVPYAVVKWANGFEGRHTITTIQKVGQESNAAITQDEFDALPPAGQSQVVDEYNRIMAAKGQALISHLKGLIGNDPGLTVTTFQAQPGSHIGSYTRVDHLKSVITLALNAKHGLSVADHEGYHYAEERLLNSEERAVVRNALLPGRPLFEKLMGKVRQYDLENQTNLADEVAGSPREAHAYAFEFWRRGELQAEGRLARAFEKILAVLREIARFITGQGFTTLEDVFSALDKGQFAERQQAGHYGDAFNGPDGVPALSRADPERWYRSALTDQVAALPMKSGTAQAWRDQIKGLVNKGLVKQAEIDAVGLEEWLEIRGLDKVDNTGRHPATKVSKDEVVSFLREHGVQVEEVVLGAPTGSPSWTEAMSIELDTLEEAHTRIGFLDEESEARRQELINLENAAIPAGATRPQFEGQGTKYGDPDYQLPGGTQYRELLLRLPSTNLLPRPKLITELPPEWKLERRDDGIWWVRSADGGRIIAQGVDRESVLRWGVEHVQHAEDVKYEAGDLVKYTAPHYGEYGKNLLAHVRLTSRVDASGAKVLFLEEIQSDWAQKGQKEGFKSAEHERILAELADIADERARVIGRLRTADAEIGRLLGRNGAEEKLKEARKRHIDASARIEELDDRRDALNQKSRGETPTAPFVTKTEAWVALVLKRMIHYAIETGHDKIAWTTGQQQVDRYANALRSRVDQIEWTKTKAGVQLVGYKGDTDLKGGLRYDVARELYRILNRNDNLGFDTQGEALTAIRTHRDWAARWTLPADDEAAVTRLLSAPGAYMDRVRTKVVDTTQAENELSDAIGKAMADQIRNDPAQSGTIEGNDITIAKAWPTKFYERIVPQIANDVLRKLDKTVKVGEVVVPLKGGPAVRDRRADEAIASWLAEKDESVQPGFQLTPTIVQKVLAGLPLFSRAAVAPGAVVNIGLKVGETGAISPEEALSALAEIGVRVQAQQVKQSNTEATLVAQLDRALTPAEAHALSVTLKQEAIAQVAGGVGELYGPGAENWRPFNPEYFLGFDKTHAWQVVEDGLTRERADAAVAAMRQREQWRGYDIKVTPSEFHKNGSFQVETLKRGAVQYSRGAVANVELPAYGRPKPGAVSSPAVHFSPTEGLTRLDSSRYGTGLQGAERASVMASPDARVKKRIHFYIPLGHGVQNEEGTGEHAYGVHLSNLYDADADPQRLWANGRESAVLDAGYDGYLSRVTGTAVLLGAHSVPVAPLGTGAAAASASLGTLSAPPLVLDANRLLVDDLIADKRLPGGMLRPAQWKETIAKVAPDLYARLPTSIYEGTAPVYRDQLVSAFYRNAAVDPTEDGLGRVLHGFTPQQRVQYSRGAVEATAQMGRQMSAGELQQAQLFQTAADMWERASERGPDSLFKTALGGLGVEVSGGISRWWQQNIATPNFISRLSNGYKNVFQVLNTYVRYRNDLVERMLIQRIPLWYKASMEDQDKAFNALNERNIKGYSANSIEFRTLLAGLNDKQRALFTSASQMFEGFLRAELEADKPFYKRVYRTPGAYEKWLTERSEQVSTMIDKGYMPLRRYGDHTVHVYLDTVTDAGKPVKLSGSLQFFSTARAAYAAARIYEEEIKRTGAELKVEVGTHYKAARDTTISAQQFLDTARRNGVPLTAFEQERLVKALTSADSLTRNRMLHREGMPGYSKDGMRVLNEFGMRMAGKLAYSKFAVAIDAASDGRAVSSDVVGGVAQIEIDGPREGETPADYKARNLWKIEGPMSGFHHNLADELTDYVLVPDHTGGWSRKLRGAAMMYFIGGSLSGALVNTMSVPMMVVPELSVHTDYATAASTTLSAWKLTWQYQHILRNIERLKSAAPEDAIPGVSPALRAALVEAAQYTMDTELHQIMGISQGALFSQNQSVQRAMKTWMAPFQASEQTNRITSFIAAYNVASRDGVRQPDGSVRRLSGPELFRFARDMIDATQNNYNETNRPGAARNPIYALMFMFKSFPLFMTEAIALMYKANPKSAVYMLLGLTALTGVQGLPFAESIEDLIDTIAQQIFGSPFNSRRAMRNMVKSASDALIGYDLSEVVLRGVINGVLGVSASSRIGAGDFVPGSRLGTADADQGRVLQAMLGAPYAMLKDSAANIGKFAGGVFTGDWKQTADALRAGGPIAVRNAIKGVEQLTQGYASDSKGKKLVDVTGLDAILQMGGLSSAGLAKGYEFEKINLQVKAFYTQVSADMQQNLVKAMKANDTVRVQEILALRDAWNQRYPEMPLMNNPAAVRRALALSGLSMDRRSQLLWARQIRGNNMFSESAE